MEDRYLFKGKRLDNEEWIFGFLSIHKTGKCFIKPINGDALSSEEIDKNTICQCTGMKDKNGRLIWENDIMKYQWDEKIRIDVVKYESPIFSYKNVIRWSLYQDEIIGNIFDNPELLESEEQYDRE